MRRHWLRVSVVVGVWMLLGSVSAAIADKPPRPVTKDKVCDPDKKGQCPDDHRCVKDGARHVCKPITDGAL